MSSNERMIYVFVKFRLFRARTEESYYGVFLISRLDLFWALLRQRIAEPKFYLGLA
jgi:hypothetical protein